MVKVDMVDSSLLVVGSLLLAVDNNLEVDSLLLVVDNSRLVGGMPEVAVELVILLRGLLVVASESLLPAPLLAEEVAVELAHLFVVELPEFLLEAYLLMHLFFLLYRLPCFVFLDLVSDLSYGNDY
jgi:hypothetical protein